MHPFNFPQRLFGLQDSSGFKTQYFKIILRFMVVKILEVHLFIRN